MDLHFEWFQGITGFSCHLEIHFRDNSADNKKLDFFTGGLLAENFTGG